MTVTAFILLTVEMASQRDILNQIRALEEVTEAHLIFGAFDIIVKAEFGSNEELSVFVVDKIKSIHGVGDTQTNIAAT